MTVGIVPWVIWGAAQVMTLAGLLLLAATADTPLPEDWAFRGFEVTVAVPFSLIGALIVARRRNRVGWVLLAVGLIAAYLAFASQYAVYALVARPGALPAAEVLAWLRGWLWIPMISLVAIYLPLVFPHGAIRDPFGRAIAAVGAAFVTVFSVAVATARGPISNVGFLENPLGIAPFHVADLFGVRPPPFLALVVIIAAAALHLALRLRAAYGVERQQLKWFAYGAFVLAVAMVIGSLAQTVAKWGEYLFVAGIGAIPVAVAVAILRYRLYDIDLVINRTIVYGATSAVLGVAYVTLVVVMQALLRPLTGGSEIAVAASTLVTVALVQPLRRRIQDAVDRRFYRARYDAQQVVDAFAARLRDRVDLDDVRMQLIAAVHAAVRPRGASVWLRETER